jgi:tetratricopeptide (TPR) repeat protein
MKYKCIPCDLEFEVKKGAKPRCPRCLKIHDLELVSDGSKGEGATKKSPLVPTLVILIAAGVGAAYYFIIQKNEAASQKEAKGTMDDAVAFLAEMDLPKTEANDPCGVTPRISKFVEKATQGDDGEEGMDAIFKALLKLKEQGKWRPYHQREPRNDRPLNADGFLAKLEGKTDKPWKALSYELACLMLASARSQDIEAQMVEISSYKGEKKPADPPGKLGRYGVVLGEAGKDKEAPLYDVYASRSKGSAKADVVPLSPGGAIAPYFGIGALTLLVKQEMSEALKLNDVAIKLDPENPYYRAGRGFIFAATGVPDEALIEFEKALKKRNDAVQKTNLAEILLLVNPMDKRPESEIQAAIDAMPDFARAHALKGMIHLMRRENDEAETELGLAERLDSKSPAVAMYWARYHAARMNSDQAVAKALEAVRLSENSVSSLLALAGIYREVARFDDMRATLDKLLAKVDTAAMASQIKQIFDYDPSEKDIDGEAEGEAEDDILAEPTPDLELKLGDGFGKGAGKGPGLGGGLGGGGLGQGGGLKLDLNLNE